MNDKSVVIIGAGPAGLTAAHELVKKGVRPVVLEKSDKVGGMARTESYIGYNFDIGGHRFFSKVEKISHLWKEMMGRELLKVSRMSRIYYKGRFYTYPLEFVDTLLNLGVMESIMIALSYLLAQISPSAEENTFDTWVSNRFGRRLYRTFFRTYTEKVWGMPCRYIQADWAAQRIKGLSLMTALANSLLGIQNSKTLIHEFYYPSKGSGTMWQRFHKAIEDGKGRVSLDSRVTALNHENGSIISAEYKKGGRTLEIPVEQIISSMPITSLISILNPEAPSKVLEASKRLFYRSFIIVILIIDKKDLFPDQWLYIHSPDVRVARIQNFKNWSRDMVPDPDRTSIGMEYFCSEGDEVWDMPDNELSNMASQELLQLNLAEADDIIDSFILRESFAYPIYDADYKDNLNIIRDYLSSIDNLQVIGRNGTHRYNNMDHSMLTGMLAAQNISGSRHNLWAINDEGEYLEDDKKTPYRQLVLENILGKTFARMDKLAFACAVGSVSGLLVFLATIWLVIKGGEVVGPNLALLGQYFIGYTVTVKGAFIALAYSFAWGFIFGWLFAYLRNLFFALNIFWIRKRTEIITIKDFFDYL